MKDLKLSFFDRRNVAGYSGPYIESFRQSEGVLYVTHSDGVETNLGQLLPAAARNLTDVTIDTEGHLQLTFDNGSTTDLGYAGDLLKVVHKDYTGTGIYSALTDDFKPLKIKDTDTEVSLVADVPTLTHDVELRTLLDDTAIKVEDLQVFKLKVNGTDSTSTPPWYVDSVLIWADTTDGVINLPTGYVRVVSQIALGNTETTEVQIVDINTQEVLFSKANASTQVVYSSPTVTINQLIYSSTPRQIVVKYITTSSTPFNSWTSGDFPDGFVLSTLTVIPGDIAALPTTALEPIEDVAIPTTLLDYVQQGATTLQVEDNLFTEALGHGVKDVHSSSTHIYLVMVSSSVIVINIETKQVSYHSALEFRASCTYSVMVNENLYVRYSNGEGLRLHGDTLERVSYLLNHNYFYPNLNRDHALYRNGTDFRCMALPTSDTVTVPALAPFTSYNVKQIIAYQEGWLFSVGEHVAYITPESTGAVWLTSYPNVEYIAGVNDTLESYSYVPDNILTPPNMTSATNDDFMVTSDPANGWNTMRHTAVQSRGWRADTYTGDYGTINIKSKKGPIAANCIFLQKGSNANAKLPSKMELWGKLGTNEFELLCIISETLESERYCFFPGGLYEADEFELRTYSTNVAYISNLELLCTNRSLLSSYLPDLTRYTGPTDVVLTGPASLNGTSLDVVTGWPTVDNGNYWKGDLSTGPITLEFDFGKPIDISKVVFTPTHEESYVNASHLEMLSTEDTWVQVGPTNLGNMSVVGSQYITTLSNVVTSKLRMVITGSSDGVTVGVGQIVFLSTQKHTAVSTTRRTVPLGTLTPRTDTGVETYAIVNIPKSIPSSGANGTDGISYEGLQVTSSVGPVSSFPLWHCFNSGTQYTRFNETTDLDLASAGGIFNITALKVTMTSYSQRPVSIAVLTSNDGVSYTEVGFLQVNRESGNNVQEVTFTAPASAKHVRVAIELDEAAAVIYYMEFVTDLVAGKSLIDPDAPETSLSWTETSIALVSDVHLSEGNLQRAVGGGVYVDYGAYVDTETSVPGRELPSTYRVTNGPYGTVSAHKQAAAPVRLYGLDGITEYDKYTRSSTGLGTNLVGVYLSTYYYWVIDVVRFDNGTHWLVNDRMNGSNGIWYWDELQDKFNNLPIEFIHGGSYIRAIAPLGDGGGLAFAYNGNTAFQIAATSTPLIREMSRFKDGSTDLYNAFKVDRTNEYELKLLVGSGEQANLLRDDAGYLQVGSYNMSLELNFEYPRDIKAFASKGYAGSYAVKSIMVSYLNDEGQYVECVNEVITDTTGADALYVLPEVITTKSLRVVFGRGSGSYTRHTYFYPLSLTSEDTLAPSEFAITPRKVSDLVKQSKISWYNTDVVNVTTQNVSTTSTVEHTLLPHKDTTATSGALSDVSGDPVVLTLEYNEPKVAKRLLLWNESTLTVERLILEGSIDGSTWTDLGSYAINEPNDYVDLDHPLDNTVAHQYYRVTAEGSGTTTRLYRFAIVMEDDLYNGHSLTHTRSEPQILQAQHSLPLPDGKTAFAITDGSVVIIDALGNGVRHTLRTAEVTWTSISYLHYDEYRGNLRVITNLSDIITISDSEITVSKATYTNTALWQKDLYTGKRLMGHVSNSSSYYQTDPVTELSEPVSMSPRGGLYDARGIPGPDGRYYLSQNNSNVSYAYYDPTVNEMGDVGYLSRELLRNIATVTRKGDIIFWPYRARNTSDLKATRVSFLGATPPSLELYKSHYLR